MYCYLIIPLLLVGSCCLVYSCDEISCRHGAPNRKIALDSTKVVEFHIFKFNIPLDNILSSGTNDDTHFFKVTGFESRYLFGMEIGLIPYVTGSYDNDVVVESEDMELEIFYDNYDSRFRQIEGVAKCSVDELEYIFYLSSTKDDFGQLIEIFKSIKLNQWKK